MLDFGIAQVRADAAGGTPTRLTRFGAPHTPRYASPEQLRGDAVTPASDVFSLAMTGLEMLGGEHPGAMNDTSDDKAAARAVRRLLQRRSEIPLALAAILRRSLRLDPAARFGDADAFLDAMDEAEEAPAYGGSASAGYASILPFPDRAAAAATASGDDDRTALADPPDARGTIAAPPFPPPAIAIPPPPPAAAAAASATAAADEPAKKPRRRMRLRTAGLLILLILAVGAAGWLVMRNPGPAHPSRPPPEHPPAKEAPAGPAGGPRMAPDEYARASRDGRFKDGSVLYVVMLASETPDRVVIARQIRDDVRAKGYDVGLANSAVYPELRDGYVVVVAGPYPARPQAEAALPDLVRDAAPDAFVRRVTLHRP